MKKNFFVLLCFWAFETISADYAGPQAGSRNAYGVPPDSFKPPSPELYPPSGWKPAGRRLVLPGESRNGYHPIDSGYGQPPPSQYGPSVDNSFPPNNQYIPGSSISGPSGNGNGFNGNGNGHGNGHNNNNGNSNGHNGNGFSNGNGHNGIGGNGVGLPNGNGYNGNGKNGNGFSTGNGHNGNGHNGNGHKGNGFSTGNGHNGNGFPTGNGHNGNGFPTGNGHNGNVFPTGNGHNGNGFPTGNGHNGNGFPTGNGHNGNGFPTGNGHNRNGNNGNGISNGGNAHNNNGHNGNGNGGIQNGNEVSGSNGKIPTFSTGPGLVYPFIQVSVPRTVTAIRPGPSIGAGNIYPIIHVPSNNHQHHSSPGIYTSLDSGTALTYVSSFPTYGTASTVSDLSNVFYISNGNSHGLGVAHPTFFGHNGGEILGNGIGQHYTIISNGLLQKSNLLGS